MKTKTQHQQNPRPPRRGLRNLTSALAVAALSLAGVAGAAPIGANWVNNGGGNVQDGSGDSLLATDIAGAPGFEQGNWNNLGRWGSGINLKDSSGAASGVVINWDAVGVWNDGASTATPDGKLMNGYLDNNGNLNVTPLPNGFDGGNNNNKPWAYVTGLSAWLAAQGACSYDVVVYCDGDGTDNRHGEYWIQSATGSWSSMSFGADLTPHIFLNDNANFSGTYTQVPNTATSNGNAQPGNYIVFTSLSADSFLLRTQVRNFRAPLNGVQIIPRTMSTPVLNSQSGSSTNYSGSTIQLAASATGCSLAYQWKAGAIGSGVYTNVVNGGNISGANTATLTISNATVANAGDYIVVVNNTSGSAQSVTPTTVTVVPVIFTTPAAFDEAIYSGLTAHFTVTVASAQPATYQWLKNGVPLSDTGNIAGSGTNTLSIANVSAADVAAYSLSVTTAYGSSTSPAGNLTLLPMPAAGTFAESVVTNKALGFWRLNETSGTAALDNAGGFNGTYGAASLYGQPGPVPPDFTGFDPSNTGLGVTPVANAWATVPALHLHTNTVTIVAWINPSGNQQAWTGIFMTRTGTQAGLGFRDTANELGFTWNNNTTWQYPSGLIVPSYQWSMVGLVIEPTKATLYMGNASNGLVSAVVVLNNQAELWDGEAIIGDDQYNTGRAFSGTIDDVAVFKQSLTPAQMLSLYAAGRSSGKLPPSISAQPEPLQLYPGRTAKFAVTATGIPTPNFQWRKNGLPLSDAGNVSGSGTPTLSLANVGAGDVASYDVVLTNDLGSVTSSVVSLTVVAAPTPGSYPAAVAAANPVAYWRLNETVGYATNAYDYFGGVGAYYGPNAYGSPGPVPPDFTGFESGNYGMTTQPNLPGAWATTDPLNLNTNTVTFAAWIYPTGPQTNGTGLFFQRAGLTFAGMCYDNYDGTRLGYNWANNATAYNFNSGLYIPQNQWSFVAVVVEPSKATLYLATNGVLQAAVNVMTHPNQAFAGISYIGNDPLSATGARIFNGTIDEVSVWNRSLSGEEIANLYKGATSSNLPPLITQQPVPRSTYTGMTVPFEVSAAGTGPLAYQWFKGGVPVSEAGNLSGTKTAKLSVTSAITTDAGNYSVIVSNNFGSVTSVVASLQVLDTSARIVWSAPIPITTADATLSLTGSVAGAAVFGTTEKTVPLTGGLTLDFKADGSVASSTGNGTATGAFLTNSTGNTNFDAVLTQFSYDGGPKTITVKQLIPGHPYTVQLFGLDDRDTGSSESGRRGYFQDPFDTNDVSATFYMSNNVYFLASFVAASTNQTIVMNLPGLDGGLLQVGNGNINALVVRDVTPAPSISVQPVSLKRYVTATAAFNAITYGTPPLQYSWQKGTGGVFAAIPGNSGTITTAVATPLSLTLTNIGASDAADYRLVVSNGSGSVTSQVATLTVLIPATGTYAAGVLSYGPIAYWRFNEASGSATSYDYLGGYDAANTAVTLGVAGPKVNGLEATNTAASYNGTSSSSATGTSLMNNRSQFTIVGWFNLAGAPNARTGLFGQNDCAEFGFHDTTSMGIWTPGGGYASFSITNLVYGQWYQAAAVGDGNNLMLYLNGALQVSVAGATLNYGSSSYPFRIGGGGILDTSGNFFNGSIDEVAVFPYALSASQINSLYLGLPTVNLTIQPDGANLKLTWPQGTLLEANDVTGPWTVNTNGSPYSVTPAGAKRFYRVQVK